LEKESTAKNAVRWRWAIRRLRCPHPCAAAMLVIAMTWGFFAAAPAFAHGPTIELSAEEMKPPLLNLYVGSTVHFLNLNKADNPGGYVVVDTAGTIESPPLEEAGDGWHYTFEEVGTHELFIRQNPEAKARIVIVPKRR
jgi:hypothetical protein